MDDGKVILIAPETKNQDGSQTFFILDPCHSEDCTDDPPEIDIIDLTSEDYQVKDTGAIAVLSTNSNTGALEITLKKKGDSGKTENMDTESGIDKTQRSSDSASSSDNISIMILDDDMNRPSMKDEDEDVDVEEISLNDVSIENEKEQKRDPELLEREVIEVEEENQQIQNDQDDEVEEGTLYIDDAKYTELQEELAQENLQELNNFKDSVIRQIEGNGGEAINTAKETENSESVTLIDVKDVEIVDEKEVVEEESVDTRVINLSFDVVSGPNSKQSSSKSLEVHEALVHGQLIEIPTDEQCFSENSESKEYVDSKNTALTLLELAGNTSYRTELEEMEKEQNRIPPSEQTSNEESETVLEETTLITLQPVEFDRPTLPSSSVAASSATEPVLESPAAKPLLQTKPETTNSPKTSVRKMTPEELVQRLREGDTPRESMSREGARRGPKSRDGHYISPIVTSADIAQEILERSMQKGPYTEPSGGDYIFAMKLAHRLATKIVPPEKPVLQPGETKDDSLKPDTSGSTRSQNTPVSKNDSASKVSVENYRGSQKKYAMSDKIELLKILEDDPDDIPTSDSSQIILEQKPRIERKKIRPAPLIKMHPELEKELALKQLEGFDQDVRKKKVSFIPETLKKIKLEKNHEHNNNFNSVTNQTNGTKKRVNVSIDKPTKKIKKDEAEAVTADPSQITETLTVEGQSLIDDASVKDSKSIKQYSNKRLSRSSETPPRQLPMDILLNGMGDDLPQDDVGSSKNKIFKATNPRKRKEELKEKRQKHFANMLQRNKPQKKRGRPPKKKVYPSDDMLNKEFLLKASLESNESKNGVSKDYHVNSNSANTASPNKEDKPIKTKKMREIERLLGDEGAINMLYSVEQKRATGGEPKRGMLPSYRRKKKDLILKTKLVKSAVLRLTTNPPPTTGRVSLRGQAPKEGESEESDKGSLRKMSVDSHDSHHSLSSPPPESFPFPAKIVPAEASRIIRRHSSSSNYSSRSNSPRRLSVDGERISVLSPEAKSNETGQVDALSVGGSKHHKQAKTPQQTLTELVKRIVDKPDRLLQEKSKENVSKERTPQQKLNVDSKKTLVHSVAKSKSKLPLKSETPGKRGRPRKVLINEGGKQSTALNTSLAAALDDFAKENKSGDKNIPADTPKKLASTAVPSSKSAKAVYKKSADSPRNKTPKASIVYNELSLKRHDHVVEICITPVSTKLVNALNSNVLKELTSVLTGLLKDENCHVVLVTSEGPVFCQGVDFPSLVHPTQELRMAAGLEMAVAIKEYIKSLAMFARPVVVGVQGATVGLGVTMLPLCDMVLATEAATFHTPYAKLGHVPEGASTLTLPSLLGPGTTSELLFACRKFTAVEAQRAGLVTRILPTENFHKELLSVVGAMATQSAQGMNATKVLLRHGLLTGLETTLVSETHLLIQHWVSAECQANFTNFLTDKSGSTDFVLTTTTAESEIGSK